MNPIQVAFFRRHWRVLGAILAFLVFSVIHLAFFRPAAARYRAALASVGGIEAVFNPGGGPVGLPPRVYALITENSITPQDAVDRGGSGALGVILVEELGRLASASGVSITSSEPGVVTQEALTAQVRVELTIQGRYSNLIAFLDQISRSRSLILVERFELKPQTATEDELHLWVSRLYLKREAGQP
jgi:hypothetical protein